MKIIDLVWPWRGYTGNEGPKNGIAKKSVGGKWKTRILL